MQIRPLTLQEREKIELYVKAKTPIRQIGRLLGRSHTIVLRELRRNKERDGRYAGKNAEERAERRYARRRKRSCKLDTDLLLRAHVVQALRRGVSPDVIAGRLKRDPPPGLHGSCVSHETIYRWVQEGEGRKEGLWRHLLSGRPKRRKRHARKSRKLHIPERISIHERPKGVLERKEVGHWESDSMVFTGQRQRLSVQYERKAKYVMVHRLSNGSAEETEQALTKSIESFPEPVWKTITFDNGGEGANHGNLKRCIQKLPKSNISPHSFRHGLGMRAVKSGIHPRYIQKILGHKNINSSQIYLDVHDEDVVKAYQKIAA
jgi:transposase, IS30 family